MPLSRVSFDEFTFSLSGFAWISNGTILSLVPWIISTGTSRSLYFNDISESHPAEKRSNFLPPIADSCSELFETIKDRSINPKPKSYTNSLLKGGDNKILKKIGEESAEFVMACKDNEPESISNEAADLIFHLQVALKYHNVDWRDVLEVLRKRRS